MWGLGFWVLEFRVEGFGVLVRVQGSGFQKVQHFGIFGC